MAVTGIIFFVHKYTPDKPLTWRLNCATDDIFNCVNIKIKRRRANTADCRPVTGTLPDDIVRPANRDWACQIQSCHTLSNKTSLQ